MIQDMWPELAERGMPQGYMKIKPIKSDKDYRTRLKVIEGLMSAEAHTPDGDALNELTTLVEAWERKQFALDLSAESTTQHSG